MHILGLGTLQSFFCWSKVHGVTGKETVYFLPSPSGSLDIIFSYRYHHPRVLHGASELALYDRLYGHDGVVLSIFWYLLREICGVGVYGRVRAQGVLAGWMAIVGLVSRTHLGGE